MPNKMDRFTNSSRLILNLTEEVAKEFNSSKIVPVHLLLAMTRAPETEAFLALDDYHIIESKLLPFVKIKRPPQATKADSIELSDAINRILEFSIDSARRHGHFWIGSGHLLIGLLRYEKDDLIGDVLDHFAVHRADIIQRTGEYVSDYASPEQKLTDHQQAILQSREVSPETISLREIFQRIFGKYSKRKNNE